MASITSLSQIKKFPDFITESKPLIQKEKQDQLTPSFLIWLGTKSTKLFLKHSFAQEKDKYAEQYEKFHQKIHNRCVYLTEKWLEKHSDLQQLIDEGKITASTDLYGELVDLINSLGYSNDEMTKKMHLFHQQISSKFPKTYDPTIAEEDARFLNFFSPDFPDALNPNFLVRVWRSILSALRALILTLQCRHFSELVSNAANASYQISKNSSESDDDKNTGWKTFLEKITALYQHFHPQEKETFHAKMLFPYRFVTYPQTANNPNRDLSFCPYFSAENELSTQVFVTQLRFHLMQFLPEIQKNLVELRSALSESYEKTSLCSLFSCPNEEKIRAAVDHFANTYFSLKNADHLCKFLHESISNVG